MKTDINEAWADLFTYMEYGERLINEFPAVRAALAYQAWRFIELNISLKPEHKRRFTKYFRKLLLPVLQVDDLDVMPITDSNIQSLNIIYMMLFTEIVTEQEAELTIPPVPKVIDTPTIIKDIILHHRDKNYQKNNLSAFIQL